MKKLGLLLIILFFLSSCSGENTRVFPVEAEEDQIDISLSDMKGKQLRLEEAAENLVLLSSQGADIIKSLGASDRVGGKLNRLSLKNYPNLKNYTMEEILSELVDGDLYIADANLDPIISEEFYRKGLPLIILDIREQGDIYRAIEILGLALGKNLAALEEIKYLERRWEELSLKHDYKGLIYIEKDGKALGARSLLGQLLSKLGYENLVKEAQGPSVDSQELERLGVDYILLIGDKDQSSIERFSKTPAGDEKRIYFWKDDNLRGSSYIDEIEGLLKILR